MTSNNAQVGRPTPEPGLWRPVLLRSLVALAFGLLTVFWPDVPAAAAGVYLLLTAAAVLVLNMSVRHGLQGSGLLLRIECIVLAVCGLVSLLAPGASTLIIGLALVLSGGLEILLGFKFRQQTVLGRDWLITGTIAAVAGILIFALANGSPRAPLGVMGGSAVIIGVALILAALTYRTDGSRGAASTSSSEQSLPGVE